MGLLKNSSPSQGDHLGAAMNGRVFKECGDSLAQNAVYTTSDNVRRQHRGAFAFLKAWYPHAFTHNLSITDGYYDSTGHNVGRGGWDADHIVEQIQSDILTKGRGLTRINAGTNSAADGLEPGTIADTLIQGCEMLLEAGEIVHLDSLRPRSDYNNTEYGLSSKDWGVGEKDNAIATNLILQEYAAQRSKVLFFDLWALHADENGDMMAAHSHDGLHINAVGARAEAVLFAAEYEAQGILGAPDYGWSQPETYDAATNLFGNLLGTSDFSTSGGSVGTGASGALAGGWTANRTDNAADDFTVAYGDDTGLDGETHKTVTLSATSTGDGDTESTYRIYTGTINLGVIPGEWYEAFIEYELSAASHVEALAMRLLDKASGGHNSYHFQPHYEYTDPSPNVPLKFTNVADKGMLHCSPIKAQDGTGFQILIYLTVDEGVSDTVELKLRKPVLRRLAKDPLDVSQKRGDAQEITGFSVKEEVSGHLHSVTMTFDDVDITINHSGGSDGHGTLKLYDYPDNQILRMASACDLVISESDANIPDSAAFKIGFGTSTQTAAGTTFGGNEDNVLQEEANTMSSSSVHIKENGSGSTGVIDGIAIDRDLYVNFIDFDTTASGTITLNGKFTMVYAAL